MHARHALFLLALAALPGALHAQQGVGAPYGARDPQPCPAAQATATRPPDVATATRAFICKAEQVTSGNLYLVSNVRLQVGGGTPYRERAAIHRPGTADPSATVYAIRGSYSKFLCKRVGPSSGLSAGENCRRYDYPTAQGTCFRDNFGEWACQMPGADADPTYGTDKQPPPRN